MRTFTLIIDINGRTKTLTLRSISAGSAVSAARMMFGGTLVSVTEVHSW